MLVPFLIMLREGIEAALIVGIIASYLQQTGRGQWMPAVWIGVFLAAALALLVGGGLELVSAEFPQKQQELFEGIVGLVAVAILSSMVFWMRKVARSIKHSLHASLDQALADSRHQVIALIAMVFFAVAREGLETVFFLLAVFQQSEGPAAPIGALLGLLLAIGIGFALYSGSMRLNLGLFFRWTGLFILLVGAGILANSVQALHEAGLWNHLQIVLFDLSAVLPMDGPLGSVLAGMFGYQDAPTVSTLGAYLLYLAITLVLFFLPGAPPQAKPSPVCPPIRLPMPNPVPAKPPKALRWAVAGSVIVMIAAGGLFYYAAQLAASKRQTNRNEITVTIHAHACEPNALTVPAGRSSFRIVNASQRAVEWEILDGVLVVEERENIAPGLSQVINAQLAPGDYAITCGLLSNPRGTLHVTPTAESAASAKARPALLAFVGPLSEYRVYLSTQGNALIKTTDALAQAIRAGDLDLARELYAPARAAYQRLAPAAQRLAELDNAIDARADYYEQREQDPAFGGFHRLEYGLFQQRSTAGLAPVAQRLQADVASLKQQLLAQSLPPEQLVSVTARNLRSLAEQRAASGEEERYSHLDLNGFAANLEATRKVIDLLRPLLSKSAAPLLARIDQASATLDSRFNALRDGAGYRPYDQVDGQQRQQIADQAKALADTLDEIDPALGLSNL